MFRESLLIIISTPIYILLIGSEILLSYYFEKKYYSVKDTLTNVYLSSLNFGLDVLVRSACLAVLNFFFQYQVIAIDNTLIYWSALLILQDLAFYFEHRIDHYCRLFWAVHVTHHSSDNFNLTTGFRSSVFQPLYRFVYFIPLALLGFKGVDIMFMYAATQIYGILIHTQHVGKLGFLELFMATPSHHRVHHASNVKYLDKNMGMVFIIWDKMFGTFAEEDPNETIEYGLTKKLDMPHHPYKIVFHEWENIRADLKRDVDWKTKMKYLFNPPGWSHDGSSKTSKQLQAELESQRNQSLAHRKEKNLVQVEELAS